MGNAESNINEHKDLMFRQGSFINGDRMKLDCKIDYKTDYIAISEIGYGHSTSYICNRCGIYTIRYGNNNYESLRLAKEHLIKIHGTPCSENYDNLTKILVSTLDSHMNVDRIISKNRHPFAKIVPNKNKDEVPVAKVIFPGKS